MNFQKIPPIETSKDILDIAFRKARVRGKAKKLKGNWLQIIRQKEAMKLDVVKDIVVPRLEKILHSFPSLDDMTEFYFQLMNLTLDYPKYKKSLGAVNWAIKKVRDLQKSYVRMIVKEKEQQKIKDLTKQFYGRLASFLKQIDSNLIYLEKSRKIMRTYPDVKDLPTVCIYGFPNVGKSTLLNKITSTKAKVASYAFTTKTINAGYNTISGKKIQFFDVPGTLARKDKMNYIEKQADLVLNELADLVIYVFDLSETSGFDVTHQKELFKSLDKKKPILVYLSKTDIMGEENVSSFKSKHYSLDELKEKIVQLIGEN
jgi:nucleolar GTP-binding protein